MKHDYKAAIEALTSPFCCAECDGYALDDHKATILHALRFTEAIKSGPSKAMIKAGLNAPAVEDGCSEDQMGADFTAMITQAEKEIT